MFGQFCFIKMGERYGSKMILGCIWIKRPFAKKLPYLFSMKWGGDFFIDNVKSKFMSHFPTERFERIVSPSSCHFSLEWFVR